MTNTIVAEGVPVVYDDGSEERMSPMEFFARYSDRIGGWFDPRGRFHEVGQAGFAEWAERNASRIGIARKVIPGFDPELQRNSFWEVRMLLAGWARACTPYAFKVRAHVVHRSLRDVLVAIAKAYGTSGHPFTIEVLGRPECFAAIGTGDGPERAEAAVVKLKPEDECDGPAEDFESNYFPNDIGFPAESRTRWCDEHPVSS